MRIVIALGGNALLRRGERPDAAIQLAHLVSAAPALAKVASEHDVVLVHGNGPQVGLLALESSADTTLSRPYPLSDLVAETQGIIGYWIQQALANAGLPRPAVALVTQTVVDRDDPGFHEATKFVGSGYDEATAREIAAQNGWTVRQDGSTWRRVVPSPRPQRIVELDTAELLLRNHTTVILAGGGGVPVVDGPDGLTGVEAVVDKDYVAALIATELHADLLVMLTDVPAVYVDFGTPGQRPLHAVAITDLDKYAFPAGSMGPKVTAARLFVEATNGRAAIGSLDDATAVVAGTAGTQIHEAGRRHTSN
ncbi:carbamate kinase [Kribbella sp. NBC_01505]|uniref:carbamate kinase n=1 Tax=Kribbella sp. NBC_01505 TaxID=2903580 RepID=UPI00386EC98F